MEEKEIVKVTTEYTKEEYIRFNKFHQRKKKSVVILNIICILVIFLAGIGLFLLKQYFMGSIYVILSILLGGLYLCAPKIFVNRVLKKNSNMKDIVLEYSFYNDKIEIKKQQGCKSIPYGKLTKVYETDTNFYLYVNKMEAFIVSKKKMKTDDIYKLAKLFQKNLKKDFI